MSILFYQTHAMVMRLLYKVIAPGHPRGWLDIHAVTDDKDSAGPLWVHCHGMEKWKLSNLEIVDVPRDLGGFAHGLLFDFTGYMKRVKPINADENFGGAFSSENQKAYHLATFRQTTTTDPDARGMLRIVDIDEPASARFPARLFAAHMIAATDSKRDPIAREQLLRRTVDIFPGSFATGEVADFDPHLNYGNFIGWESLSDALVDQRRVEEGLRCLDQAVARCPQWARSFAEAVGTDIRERNIPPDSDPRFRYWIDLDVADAIARAKANPLAQDGATGTTAIG